MNPPVFISVDPLRVVSDIVALFEAELGKTLQPAQVERLIANSIAYRETLLREGVQYTGEQNLVRFANAPALDYLGELVGVTRTVAKPAEALVTFAFITSNPGGVIQAGTRIQSSDGLVAFATIEPAIVAPGATSLSLPVVALTPGSIGNDYLAGQVSAILDPNPIIASAANTNTTAGGADPETDEGLRERIMLAPSSFSNAGSRGAYIFWAKTANPDIADVAVISPTPGEVEVYVLMLDGEETPSQVIGQVSAAVNDEKIRPLTDGVTVSPAVAIAYNITLDLILLSSADGPSVLSAVDAAINTLVLDKRRRLGRDITSSEVIAAAQVAGVYRASLAEWMDVVVDEGEYPKLGTYTRNVTGTNNG